MKRFSIIRGVVVGAIFLASVWLAIYLDNQRQPAPAPTGLIEIKDIKTLRAQFNDDAGKTRLILLVSPT